MAKNTSKKLPRNISILDPIFYIEKVTNPETGGVLFNVHANLVGKIEVDNEDNPTQLVLNGKYNLPFTAAPGVKKINEVIIDEADAMDTLEAHVKTAKDEYKAEIKKLEKRISDLDNLFEMYSRQPLSNLIKSPLDKTIGVVEVTLKKEKTKENEED